MLVVTGHSFVYLKVLQLSNFISLYRGLLLFTLYIQGNHPLEVKDSAAHIHLDLAPRDLHMLVNLCYFKMSSVSNNSFGFPFFSAIQDNFRKAFLVYAALTYLNIKVRLKGYKPDNTHQSGDEPNKHHKSKEMTCHFLK